MKLGDSAAGAATAVIAYIFAVEPGTPEERGALYRRAASIAPAACRCGPWDELRDLAVMARNDALGSGTPAEVRKGALALLGVLEQPKAAHALVAAAASRDRMTPALEALLAAPGAGTIWAVAQRMAADPPSPGIDRLKEYLLRLGPQTWRRAAEMIASFPENEALALLPLASGLPRRLAREVVTKMSEHPDGKVKVLAQAFLAALRPDPALEGAEKGDGA